MRAIQIDLEIHKLIEAERLSFEETDNSVLRRLLKLEPPNAPSAFGVPSSHSTGRPWKGDGIELRHGTIIYMTYGRGSQEFFGRIEDGHWVVDGQRYKTPSGAASGCATKPDGSHPVLGGFKYWHVLLPGEKDWISLASYREGRPVVTPGIPKPPGLAS